MSYSPLTARVTTSSTISVKRGLYSVPSRLIGEQLRVHLYHDRLECYLGQSPVITLARVYGTTPVGRARNIDYRHIIHSLAAKPQAFRFSTLRDDLLPSAAYHKLWALAQSQFTPQQACKWKVAVLRIACDHDCESVLAEQLLEQQQLGGELPALKTLQARYIGDPKTPPIPVRPAVIPEGTTDFFCGVSNRIFCVSIVALPAMAAENRFLLSRTLRADADNVAAAYPILLVSRCKSQFLPFGNPRVFLIHSSWKGRKVSVHWLSLLRITLQRPR